MFKSIFFFLTLLSAATINAKDSDALILNFNNPEVGVAFTMLSEQSWKNPGSQNFHGDPSNPQKSVQAITISNSSKEIWPYAGDTRYGLVLSVDSTSNFYKYFATKSKFKSVCPTNTGKLVSPITKAPGYDPKNPITNWAISCEGQEIAFCGRCSDGGICAGSGTKPITSNGLWPALGDQVPYTEFAKAKNAIVAATGKTCKWINTPNAWNEFDTNGLSASALRGVIIDGITPGNSRSWVPSKQILCKYFQTVDSTKTEWPQYKLLSAGQGTGKSVLKKVGTVSCIKHKG